MQTIGYILLACITTLAAPLFAIRLIWAAITNKECARRIALSWDDLLNVVTNGAFRVTVSLRSAQAMQEGKRWGCVMCKFLDVLLGKRHCDKALSNFESKEK